MSIWRVTTVWCYLFFRLISSQSETVTDGNLMFAIIGENQCAEELHFGSATFDNSSDLVLTSDGHEFYFSTSLADYQHTQWVQVVTITVDGSDFELYRIQWNFSDEKTLRDRMITAVRSGESTTFNVISGGEITSTMHGNWWFSSAAGTSETTFEASGSSCCFSNKGGAWGAGLGTIDGNDYAPNGFTGQGRFIEDSEATCRRVYFNREARIYGPSKSYLYLVNPAVPSPAPSAIPAVPTAAPTMIPTAPSPMPTVVPTAPSPMPTVVPTAPSPIPTVAPSRPPTQLPSITPTDLPTSRPTFGEKKLKLVAVFSDVDCTGRMNYGVDPIENAPAGTSFFSFSKEYDHSEWVQDIALSTGKLQLRIIWQFAEKKSLVQRLEDAVAVGEEVDFIVLDRNSPGIVLTTLSGNWRLSSNAFYPGMLEADILARKHSTCCLSADGAAWGAGSGEIDGSGNQRLSSDFWGITLNAFVCPALFLNGNQVPAGTTPGNANSHPTSAIESLLYVSNFQRIELPSIVAATDDAVYRGNVSFMDRYEVLLIGFVPMIAFFASIFLCWCTSCGRIHISRFRQRLCRSEVSPAVATVSIVRDTPPTALVVAHIPEQITAITGDDEDRTAVPNVVDSAATAAAGNRSRVRSTESIGSCINNCIDIDGSSESDDSFGETVQCRTACSTIPTDRRMANIGSNGSHLSVRGLTPLTPPQEQQQRLQQQLPVAEALDAGPVAVPIAIARFTINF